VRRTQVERRQDAERALLAAAVRLFAAKGIERTSLAEIGEEAGYSRGLANHHFGSKAALVERLADLVQEEFVRSLLEVVGPGDDVESFVRLVQIYLGAVRARQVEARAFLVMWGAALPGEASLRPVLVADDARFRDGVESYVRLGQTAGTISATVDPAGFAVAFVGLLRGIAAQFLVDPEGVDLDAAGSVCEQLVRASLQPTSAAADAAGGAQAR
jgi:AcrR family transcriptional regulator